jgi:hypothetical protein
MSPTSRSTRPRYNNTSGLDEAEVFAACRRLPRDVNLDVDALPECRGRELDQALHERGVYLNRTGIGIGRTGQVILAEHCLQSRDQRIWESPTPSSATPTPYQPQGHCGWRSVAHWNSPAASS